MKCFKILMMFYIAIGIVKVLNNPTPSELNIQKNVSPTFAHISHKL